MVSVEDAVVILLLTASVCWLITTTVGLLCDVLPSRIAAARRRRHEAHLDMIEALRRENELKQRDRREEAREARRLR